MTRSVGFATSPRPDALLPGASEAQDALTLFTETSRRLRVHVPFDAAVWRGVDPVSGLMTSPVLGENIADGGCAVYWDTELLYERVNVFSELARAAIPAVGLRDSTGDQPERSAVYGRFLRPRGLADELRVVLRVDGRSHGQVSLFRERGRPSFRRSEAALLADLSGPLARRLRSYAEPVSQVGPHLAASGPGLLIIDPTGKPISMNDEARSLLAELPPGPGCGVLSGVVIPAWVHGVVVRARTASTADAGARVRLRSTTGRWLVGHASCLRQEDGQPGPTAVVIEPARRSETADLLSAAYQLTPRELDIVECVARGGSTGEIAEELFLSPHTVRDHLKTIFEKVGVSSRGELVAHLFLEHIEPVQASRIVRVEHD